MDSRACFPHPTRHVDYHVFQNQLDFGKNIADLFLDRNTLHVLALALTQSGKTGSMLSVIQHCLAHPDLSLPSSNISSLPDTPPPNGFYKPKIDSHYIYTATSSTATNLTSLLTLFRASTIFSLFSTKFTSPLDTSSLFASLFKKLVSLIPLIYTPEMSSSSTLPPRLILFLPSWTCPALAPVS